MCQCLIHSVSLLLYVQIHPLGHSILSRNISYDEKTEWSCIHDINEESIDVKEHIQEEHKSSKRKRKLVCDSDEESNSGLGGGGDESGDSTDDFLFSINRRQRALRSRLPGRGGMYPKMTSIGIKHIKEVILCLKNKQTKSCTLLVLEKI